MNRAFREFSIYACKVLKLFSRRFAICYFDIDSKYLLVKYPGILLFDRSVRFMHNSLLRLQYWLIISSAREFSSVKERSETSHR